MTSDSKRYISNQIKELISLQKASEYCRLSQTHLRLLVRTGELQGWKIGRNWVTTKSDVDCYLKKNRKPGPKKKS